METILYTAIGVVLGGIITYLVGKYYYKKNTKEKSLTPFLQFVSGVLTDVDPQVKEKLKVHYDKQEVTDLYQIQFVIANTGDVPIRDCIQPLALEIPQNGEVLDVSILHIEPEGRQVSYEIKKQDAGTNRVTFLFPLLNASEFFIAKMLIKGKLPSPGAAKDDKQDEKMMPLELRTHFEIASHYKFYITVDDLPPTIISKRLPPYQYELQQSFGKLNWGGIVAALIIGFCSLCLAYAFYSFKDTNPSLFIFNFAQFFGSFSALSFAIIVGWIVALVFLIAGFGIIISELMDLRPKRKPKFRIPSKLTKRYYPFYDMRRF